MVKLTIEEGDRKSTVTFELENGTVTTTFDCDGPVDEAYSDSLYKIVRRLIYSLLTNALEKAKI